VPRYIARSQTIAVRVTALNIDSLRQRVTNGPHHDVGATIVCRDGGNHHIHLGMCEPENLPVLKIGDVVHRNLQNNDIVIFNRQPVLCTRVPTKLSG